MLGLSQEAECVLHRVLDSAHEEEQKLPRVSTEEPSENAAFQARKQAIFFGIVPPVVPNGGPLRQVRESLPVYAYRDKFLEASSVHNVLIVEGDTGCGKTTQFPQYILEAASESGTPCSIVVTQPRRISAIGVAERVAEERGERCGDCVGYSIRLKSRASASTALLFCTLGVLLRRLEADPELLGATHVFVDEVHERSVEVDLVLLALLDLRQRRPELRIILMSATLDGDLLSRYFDGAPSLKVPGRTFPVTALFLEDALEITKHTVDRFAEWAARVRSGNLRYTGRSSYSGGQSQTVELESSRIEDLSPHAVKERYFRYSGSVQSALAALDPDAVNYELAAQLVTHFLTQPVPEGPRGQKLPAILVFLSGAREIQKMRSALFSVSPNLAKEPMCSWILVLHSSLSPEEQRRVFEHPPPKARKVILATNIAEASITIDDVGVVVDTARVKELRYDSARRLASLEDVFVSRTSARQRRGRAGRVAPGTCVHLVTKYSHDRLLGDRPSAEVNEARCTMPFNINAHAWILWISHSCFCELLHSPRG